MKFGPVPTRQAMGAVLAHSLPLTNGRLRKGQLLGHADIDALLAAGHETVSVASYEAGDLPEDQAAAQLAAALAGAGLRVSQAATGRVNLFATGPGIVEVDIAAIDSLNAVNPMITVATLPRFYRVSEEVMVATIKIISYAVPQVDVAKCAAIGAAAMSVVSPKFVTADLIETRMDAAPNPKGRDALQGRLDRLNIELSGRVIVSHERAALAQAIADAQSEVVFVLTASATSDPADVGPAALQDAGGTLTQFGMPVDPGNLLFLGYIGQKPVIGLPGCARSPALNGADWVLERVICGIAPTPSDFARMGVGGLLKEIPTRPKPRAEI